MQQGYRTMDLVQGPQHGQGDGVVAADGNEPLVLADQGGQGLLLDFTDGPGDVVGGGAGDVAGVHYLGFVHRFNVELRVVPPRAEEAGGFADCGGGRSGRRAGRRFRRRTGRRRSQCRSPGRGRFGGDGRKYRGLHTGGLWWRRQGRWACALSLTDPWVEGVLAVEREVGNSILGDADHSG